MKPLPHLRMRYNQWLLSDAPTLRFGAPQSQALSGYLSMSNINLDDSLYLLDDEAEQDVSVRIKALEERVSLLRNNGSLTEETIKDYYGEKRFEQVAESNAIEGSTLSIGETELAVLKGITITGHDPAYVRDALALDKALQRLSEMAREVQQPTDIEQLLELHGLILGDRPGAGMFRKEPVRISGSDHVPPKTWQQVMNAMEDWEQWSRNNETLPAPIRAAVLHAWLSHIHPFIDGNGRTARAITNLELVRAGYPPIIIKKKEKDRYIEALSESDSGGDIRTFFELVFEKIEGALIGLELSAKKKQGFSPVQEKIRQQQQRQFSIWDSSINLLARTIEHQLQSEVEPLHGRVSSKIFESPLDLDDYLALCEGKSAQKSWAFIFNIQIPGFERQTRLAYVGFRSQQMFHELGDEGGPALLWSKKNPEGFPKWVGVTQEAPYASELTTKLGAGDEWYAKRHDGTIEKLSTTKLAEKIAIGMIELASYNQ